MKEVEITKKDGGVRKLGIPTILDRIAQEVVKSHLESIVEPHFHNSSFGYRRGRSCHDAVDKVLENIMTHDWVIDLDIQRFFDTIDLDLMIKAVSGSMAKDEVHGGPEFILPLENCASIGCINYIRD